MSVFQFSINGHGLNVLDLGSLKSVGAKVLQDIYLQYFVTSSPSRLYFGTDTTQSSPSPTGLVIFVKYVFKSGSIDKAICWPRQYRTKIL